MRRLLLLLGFVAICLAFASQAAAGTTTTVPVSMTFTEPILKDIRTGCPVFPDGFCGSGIVVPFGHATETILFGGACSGACDLRTVNLARGSIFIDETFSNFQCPGACQSGKRGIGFPGSGTLTDVIVGGTGIFTRASGNVSGSVTVGGLQSLIQLSGSITLTS